MKVAIQKSEDDEAKALQILLRHLPGQILADRTYSLDESAVELLRKADVEFIEVSISE